MLNTNNLTIFTDIARGLRRMKTETDKEIVASNEARRRIKLRAMKEVHVKMGIKEKYDEKKGRNKRKEKKEMHKCEKV